MNKNIKRGKAIIYAFERALDAGMSRDEASKFAVTIEYLGVFRRSLVNRLLKLTLKTR